MKPAKRVSNFVFLLAMVYTITWCLLINRFNEINVKYLVFVASQGEVLLTSHNNAEDIAQIKSTVNETVLHDATRTTATIDSWLVEQAKRKERFNDFCRDHPSLRMNMTDIIHNKKDLLVWFLVNDKYKILYACLCKVGSTHWKKAFLVLNGQFKRVEDVPDSRFNDPSLKRLNQYTPDEIEYRLRNYSTFMFARHPLARVLSTYRNKLEEKNRYYHMLYGKTIIKKYRENPSELDLKTGANVKFSEFIQFVLDNNNTDGHWDPIYKMVLPCNIHYDYIGKLETAKEDAEHILKYLKVDHLVHLVDSKRIKSHNEEIFNKYYQNISPDYVHELYKMYRPDFQLFDYPTSNNLSQSKNSGLLN